MLKTASANRPEKTVFESTPIFSDGPYVKKEFIGKPFLTPALPDLVQLSAIQCGKSSMHNSLMKNLLDDVQKKALPKHFDNPCLKVRIVRNVNKKSRRKRERNFSCSRLLEIELRKRLDREFQLRKFQQIVLETIEKQCHGTLLKGLKALNVRLGIDAQDDATRVAPVLKYIHPLITDGV